jgi:hypothetical protein
MTAPADWVRDLLGLWAERDWHDAQMPLGLPTVSPMFAKGMGISSETEDVGGYSTIEVKVMAEAVEWLREHKPDHWRALSREIRPWSRKDLPKTDNDRLLVVESMLMLQKIVDETLD